MMERRILLVDNDKSLLNKLKFALEQDGYVVEFVSNAEEALERIRKQSFNLVITEIDLHGMSGLELCQYIHGEYNIPLMFLSDRKGEMDEILGLEYGADDYITKPANLLVIKARVKAIMRRVLPKETGYRQHIENHGLTLNMGSRSVKINGEPINLTVKEFDLLCMLMNSPGRVFSREELMSAVWGTEYVGDVRTVDVHMRHLREKIEADATDPQFIMTKWGVGYFFANHDDERPVA